MYVMIFLKILSNNCTVSKIVQLRNRTSVIKWYHHHHIINAANTSICFSLVKQLVGLKTFEGFLHPAGNVLLMMTMLMLLLMTMPKPSFPTRTFDFVRIYVWHYNWKWTYHVSCEDNDGAETLESNCEIQWCVRNSHSFHWILSHVGSGVLVMLTTE